MSKLGFVKICAAVAAALFVGAVAAACATDAVVLPLEDRAHELNKTIMCPVCPGESIDQSQNALARQMRVIVAEKLEQGWSENQIQTFFVERYGPSVLMEPPRRGFGLLAWLLPPVGVVAAVVALYAALRVMRRSPDTLPDGDEGALQLSDDERADYFRRIELALDDGGATARPEENDVR
jgi:cytochrome c-type biogenesis protein CcmH